MVWDAPVKAAMDQRAADARRIDNMLRLGTIALAIVLALAGVLLSLPRLTKDFRARNRVEGWISGLLIACSAVAVLTTLGIVLSLLYESLRFFHSVSPLSFLFGTEWSPQIAIRADQVGQFDRSLRRRAPVRRHLPDHADRHVRWRRRSGCSRPSTCRNTPAAPSRAIVKPVLESARRAFRPWSMASSPP